MPKQVTCPDCGEAVSVGEEKKVGDVIECPVCGAEMEIVNLEPLEVSLIEEEK